MDKEKYNPQITDFISNYSRFIIIGIPVFFCIAGYLFIVGPYNAKEETIKNKIKILAENQKQAEKASLDAQKLLRLKNQFVNKKESSAFLEEILKTARDFNIDIATIQPQHEEMFQDKPSLTFTITAHGLYKDIKGFIQALGNSPKIILVEEFGINGFEARDIMGDVDDLISQRTLMNADVEPTPLNTQKYGTDAMLEFRMRARIFLNE